MIWAAQHQRAGVSAPVQYGPHAAAIAVYLCLGQHLPVERTAGLLAELFGTLMATGTVAAWTHRAAARLAPFTAAAVATLTDAELMHADETGLQETGRLYWLHMGCSTCYGPWAFSAPTFRRGATGRSWPSTSRGCATWPSTWACPRSPLTPGSAAAGPSGSLNPQTPLTVVRADPAEVDRLRALHLQPPGARTRRPLAEQSSRPDQPQPGRTIQRPRLTKGTRRRRATAHHFQPGRALPGKEAGDYSRGQ